MAEDRRFTTSIVLASLEIVIRLPPSISRLPFEEFKDATASCTDWLKDADAVTIEFSAMPKVRLCELEKITVPDSAVWVPAPIPAIPAAAD